MAPWSAAPFRALWVTVAVFGLLIIGVCLLLKSVTSPYLIKPASRVSPPVGAAPGTSFNASTHSLSVVSDVPLVVVADPGKSFKHEVIWVIAQAAEKKEEPMEYRFNLSEYTVEKHIHPPGVTVPPEIKKAANRW